MSQINLRTISPENEREAIVPLSVILSQCVQQGASIGFLLPFDVEQANLNWQQVYEKVHAQTIVLMVAEQDGIIIGTVQLHFDLPDNQAHRADVAKLLVHPQHQRKGIATALMQRLEQEALLKGRTLLVLDTKTGENAEHLYSALGYVSVGMIPGFAQNPELDGFAATTIMYKNIRW